MAQKRKQYPSQARLRELFDYDPEGFLVWRSGTRAGKRAGSYGVSNDLRVFYDIRINGVIYSGAKLIFVYFKGSCPNYIYHKNQDQHDNRFENLIGAQSRHGHGGGRWKTLDREFMYIEKEKNGKSWFNTIGKKRWFTTAAAAAYNANIEIDKLGLNYQKNVVDRVDLEKFVCHGHRQIKNRKNATSIYLGVSRHQNKWTVKCAHKYIGVYETEEQAARAYNKAAYEHYGEHAVLNDIPDPLGLAEPEEGDAF